LASRALVGLVVRSIVFDLLTDRRLIVSTFHPRSVDRSDDELDESAQFADRNV